MTEDDERTTPGDLRRSAILKIRVPKSMVSALEEYLEALRTQPPFIRMSRAEAIRWLIAVGLERERADRSGSPRRGRPD